MRFAVTALFVSTVFASVALGGQTAPSMSGDVWTFCGPIKSVKIIDATVTGADDTGAVVNIMYSESANFSAMMRLLKSDSDFEKKLSLIQDARDGKINICISAPPTGFYPIQDVTVVQ